MRYAPSGRPMPTVHRTDPASAGVDWPDYQRLRGELASLTARLAEAEASLREHAGTQRAAEQADHDAYTAAVRAGKPDPGRKHTEGWEARQSDLLRHVTALRTAVVEVDDELDAVAAQHEPEYRTAATAAQSAAAKEYRLAIENLVEMRERLVAADEVVLLLDAVMGGGGVPTSPRRHRLPTLTDRANSEPYGWEVVVAALRQDAERERPKAAGRVGYRRRVDISDLIDTEAVVR